MIWDAGTGKTQRLHSNHCLLPTHRLMKEMSFYFPCISWTRCFVSSQGELGVWFRCQGPPEPRLAEPTALPEAAGVWRKLFASASCPPQASHTVSAFWHLYRRKLSRAGQHREYFSVHRTHLLACLYSNTNILISSSKVIASIAFSCCPKYFTISLLLALLSAPMLLAFKDLETSFSLLRREQNSKRCFD